MGETDIQAALRELYEETGMTATLDTTKTAAIEYPISDFARKQVVFFLGEVAGETKVREGEIDKTNITPVWRRYTLTVEEAAGYYHIGENKLRSLIDEHPHENFYVMNGNRVLIKRAKFEEYLDQATAV